MVGQALGGIICAVALVAFSSLFVNRHPFFLDYSERAKAEERVDSMRRTGSILGKDSLLRETVTHTQPPLLQLE
jgi:hypothetical protein